MFLEISLSLSSSPSNNISQISDTIKRDFGVNRFEFKKIYVTGGGSFKYSSELKNLFGTFFVSDEMRSLVNGAFFVLDKLDCKNSLKLKYPVLLVNVGTGASFISIDENRNFKRVGGTNIAGGTLNGLFRMLQQSNQSMMNELIQSGDRQNADILVKDIYGSTYESVGLDGNVVAGSLAKLDHYQGTNLTADICASSAFMICSNLIHLIYLYATIHGSLTVLFSGSFPSIPAISSILTSTANSFFSGKIESEILKYGGYLGCFGVVYEILTQ